jgi:hypothetical protein
VISDEELDSRFDHHPPVGDRAARHARIRALAKQFARQVRDSTPEGREQSLAITHLEEVVFWANAAIAREG